MLEVAIPHDIESKIKQISRERKMSESSIVTNALRYYLPLIEEGLETEFELWDALSDEALISFENKLQKIDIK
ncbi:hypothetical protein M1O17_06080 [Dehalococcoidia bacterium]|nr:hypothetical protein [Dehalococcoidia bacterium]MCL0074299.1 hypothetical protein [Dehalococcoidia bacterium]MCL0076401.1 hypothetical protein [Dehalococcoidia bacterium]